MKQVFKNIYDWVSRNLGPVHCRWRFFKLQFKGETPRFLSWANFNMLAVTKEIVISFVLLHLVICLNSMGSLSWSKVWCVRLFPNLLNCSVGRISWTSRPARVPGCCLRDDNDCTCMLPSSWLRRVGSPNCSLVSTPTGLSAFQPTDPVRNRTARFTWPQGVPLQ